ncbi:MAG TPA: AraC family transcriptional regulator [Bacteroidales bacterium]|nr:AraC family transcriptional regulator [Bacteroidales bacterium]
MRDIFKIESIAQLNKLMQQDTTKHPLVTVVDFTKMDGYNTESPKLTSSFYSVMLKNRCHSNLKYGRQYYDFEEGTLVFIAPEQVIEMENEPEPKEQEEPIIGWGLFFHPDLLRGTSLASKMRDFTFFSYDTHEALHLSEKEKQLLADIISKIEYELDQNIDKHSQSLIVSNIELLLNYCTRFYDRQFITRKNNNKDILAKFENIVINYFGSEEIKQKGLPSVKFCADKLNLSANYLSDLLKKETGKNAQEHIHYYLIEEAKNLLLSTHVTVSEIAYDLGFEYPQYFSKMFKKKTGMTPAEFRNLN